MNASLSIIIVNYKTPDLTIQCVESIKDHLKYFNKEIIIVDNNSCDDSKEKITRRFIDIRWIQNDDNVGFGRANNQAIAWSENDLILLLNSDTRLIDDSFGKMISYYIDEPEFVTVVSCRFYFPDMTEQKSVFYYNASYTELWHDNIICDFLDKGRQREKHKDVKALHGACLLFSKHKLKNIGFFDEDFFLYAEEAEWCYRIVKNNGKLKSYQDVQIIHHEGKSKPSNKWNEKQRMVSRALLFRKTRGPFGYVLYLFIVFVNCVTNFLFLWKMDSGYRKGYLEYYSSFFGLFRKHIQILFLNFPSPLKIQ